MSTFVNHQAKVLLQRIPSSHSTKASDELSISSTKYQKLQTLASSLQTPLPKQILVDTIGRFVSELGTLYEAGDGPETSLAWTAATRALAGVYSEVMGSLLEQATQADSEAEWWGQVERVGGGTAWYLLQSKIALLNCRMLDNLIIRLAFPHRLARFGNYIIQDIRSREESISLESFSPRAIDRLFPPRAVSQLFTRSFFPHLAQPHNLLQSNPIELARQECRKRRLELEAVRDHKAELLGKLAAIKGFVEQTLKGSSSSADTRERVKEVIAYIEAVLQDDGTSALLPSNAPQPNIATSRMQASADRPTATNLLPQMHQILVATLPAHAKHHKDTMVTLQRPSRLTRMWPRIVFLPPLAFIVFRMLFATNQQFYESLREARDTISGFWGSWVVDPIKGILNTVRSGGDETVRMVSKEGLKSDMDVRKHFIHVVIHLTYGPTCSLWNEW